MKGGGRLRPKASKQDDSIMGTNNSSIVSKRSVERLYYPNEPHFFRYFVKKPQRRAPLINRGYWLRMKAIDHVVSQFLKETTEKKKIIVNLGCGYDPLPWQSWARYPEASRDVTFVDIDYKDLVIRKRDMVQQTSELNSVLKNPQFPEDGDVLLRSEQYLQVGCDLRDLTRLEKFFSSEFDLSNSVVFCTAEVSIAYMDVETSDALIKWIGSLPYSRFCLLEQLLPGGPSHPFAKTMLAHFDKLQTPLRPVLAYPTTQDQENRFKKAGWADVRARNLWELWGSLDFLSSEERMQLDEIEPFDEWEEFALFGCHYTLLEASNVHLTTNQPHNTATTASDSSAKLDSQVASFNGKMVYTESAKSNGIRRFGASLSVKGENGCPDLKGNFGGMGVNNRLGSIDIFTSVSQGGSTSPGPTLRVKPETRMCHTLTEIGDCGSLLVGGRSSPDKAFADCWLYSKLSHTWERVDDIPVARYRHSASTLDDGSVLVTGGKKDSKTVLSDTYLWNRQTGWRECLPEQDGKPLVFGALMISDVTSTALKTNGFLVGGMSTDGRVSTDLWSWELNKYPRELSIRWTCHSEADKARNPYMHRFGACWTQHDEKSLVVGGIIPGNLIPEHAEIVALDTERETGRLETYSTNVERCDTRPLLIGHSITTSGRSLLVMGGGAVCFSFGTFWNKGCYTILPTEEDGGNLHALDKQATGGSEPWSCLNTVDSESSHPPKISSRFSPLENEKPREPITIGRKKISSWVDFAAILSSAEPIILEGLDIGSCTDLWTNSYLVTVHRANEDRMDFVSKNFQYVTKDFGNFIESIEKGEKLYLRSLAVGKPSELPADISRDFPEISGDFHLPPQLAAVEENQHSSPLRISGPVSMWLHYDVMSNVLCQIRGQKRLLLFPPGDVEYFDFAAGASSSSVDAFGDLTGSKAAASHPHEANLNPGDILFLPSLWLHTAKPLDGVSVSVNVFFRGLQHGYAAGKDVYGNRDLQAYEKGRQDIVKLSKMFENLPPDIRKFYLLRLADELDQKARSS
ncbi:hypothetical protein V493_07264 [Pseudogymnoascus sp. VKM F-4281 (FW-2241)]|nr:hypothetical protein V493_07264 [Pseudogymnoascus sp. VKM F-4281 (FW-2241)]